jgi:hypothetical protein
MLNVLNAPTAPRLPLLNALPPTAGLQLADADVKQVIEWADAHVGEGRDDGLNLVWLYGPQPCRRGRQPCWRGRRSRQ